MINKLLYLGMGYSEFKQFLKQDSEHFECGPPAVLSTCYGPYFSLIASSGEVGVVLKLTASELCEEHCSAYLMDHEKQSGSKRTSWKQSLKRLGCLEYHAPIPRIALAACSVIKWSKRLDLEQIAGSADLTEEGHVRSGETLDRLTKWLFEFEPSLPKLDDVYLTFSEWEEASVNWDGVFPYHDGNLGGRSLLETIEKDEELYSIHNPQTW